MSRRLRRYQSSVFLLIITKNNKRRLKLYRTVFCC